MGETFFGQDRLRAAWLALGGFYLTVIAHAVLYRWGQGQCTSTACMALALGQVVLAAAVIGLALALRHPLAARARAALARIPPTLYLAGAGMVLLGFGFNLRPEWFYAHMSLALSGLLALGYVTLYGPRPPAGRTAALALLLLAAVSVLVRALALSAHPSIHILDEPWTLGWALSYLRIGQPGDWIVGNVTGVPYPSPRYFALTAVWMQIVGVGLWEGRLFSLLMAALLTLLTVLAARRLFDRPTAWAVLLALIASSVLPVGLRLRHDIGLGVAVAASLWLWSRAREGSGWSLHGLAGLVIGVGMAAHYHAVGLGVALIAGLYLPDYAARLRAGQWKPPIGLIAYGIGGLIGGLAIVLLQIVPSLDQYQTIIAPRTPTSFGEFVESLIYHIAQVPGHSPLEFILLVAAVIAALWRRTRVDLALALSLVLGYIALGVMASKVYGPFDYYSVPLVPLFALLIGRMWRGRASIANRLPARTALVGLFCLLMPQFGYSLHGPAEYVLGGGPLRTPPPEAAQWVLDNVAADQTVVAEHLYFLWLHDYPYLSPLTPTYLPPDHKVGWESLALTEQINRAWHQLAPNVVIHDPTLATSGMLDAMVESGYLEEAGFEAVFSQPAGDRGAITVYQRP
jgi:hypothetical protein